MKRIFILFGVLAIAAGAQAQYNQKSNYIGFNVNGGMNTMLFNPANGSYTPGLGFGGGLRYAHFFGSHFGVGLGVQYNRAQASALYDFTEVTQGLTHDDNPGVTYDLHTTFGNWRERQTLTYLGIPVELYWRAPMGERWFFLAGVGAQFDLPLHGEYDATEGSYRTEGYFPATGHMVSNMPDHGFRTWDADDIEGSEFTVAPWGVSVVADLGFNYAFSNHWGVYFGLYGSFGLTDMLDSASTEPLALINADDASRLDYNGTFGSDQIDALRLLNVGVKVGINFGWNCTHSDKTEDNVGLVAYEAQKADQEKAAREKAEQEQAARLKAEQEKAAAEAAAREASINALRMNDADLAAAIANIDADLEKAEAAANESGDARAKDAVAKAKAKAAEAKKAHSAGQYGSAYDLFAEAYGSLADSYASDADANAKKNGTAEAKKAADDAALYAESAHKGDLGSAMASSGNARINNEVAKRSVVVKPAEKPVVSPVIEPVDKAAVTPDSKPVEKAPAKPVAKPTAEPAAKDIDRAQLQKYLDQINATVHFDFAQTKPKFDSKTDLAIRALCAAMKADKNVKVLITGHTDNIGSAESNMTYGKKRAEALKQLMVNQGAPAASISTASKGEDEPVVENDTDEHRYQNRRAVITLR